MAYPYQTPVAGGLSLVPMTTHLDVCRSRFEERLSHVDVLTGPVGILGLLVAIFVALGLAAIRWGVVSRKLDRLPEW
jgi:hypothetical protein